MEEVGHFGSSESRKGKRAAAAIFFTNIKILFMNTIKAENILRVIENFKKVLPMAVRERHLKMSASEVTENGCGTVHCHGGWYAVAVCDLTRFVGWSDGASEIASRLGFSSSYHLKKWSMSHKELWGNDSGTSMFCDEMAFFHPTKRPEGAKNLQHIIDHWTEVYERVKALEESSQVLNSEPNVQECDATKSIVAMGWEHNPSSIAKLFPETEETVDLIKQSAAGRVTN